MATWKLGKVSSTCLVSIDRCRYSAPCELVGQMVSIRIYPERLDFIAHDRIVASHVRSFERNQTCYDWQHYIPSSSASRVPCANGAHYLPICPSPCFACADFCSNAKVETASWPRYSRQFRERDWKAFWSPSNWSWSQGTRALNMSRMSSTG